MMYEVPIFHGLSTEYAGCAWNYFVRHYTDDAQQARDSKVVKRDGRDWIWYPRAGTLGGCTAHNAMITVVPQDDDWNSIADLTGDPSWRADRMRSYFERLENCRYVPAPGTAESRRESGPVQHRPALSGTGEMARSRRRSRLQRMADHQRSRPAAGAERSRNCSIFC